MINLKTIQKRMEKTSLEPTEVSLYNYFLLNNTRNHSIVMVEERGDKIWTTEYYAGQGDQPSFRIPHVPFAADDKVVEKIIKTYSSDCVERGECQTISQC